MSSPALEAHLARLYTDEAALSGFLADPGSTLAAAGLDAVEKAAMIAIDRDGLIMAARSIRAKRAACAKPARAGWLRRSLAMLRRRPIVSR